MSQSLKTCVWGMTQKRFRANISTSVEFDRLMAGGKVLKTILATLLFALTIRVVPAFCADLPAPPPGPPGEYAQSYGDPLAPFNEKMFWFNLKLDKYVLHPVASGYAFVLPKPARESVGNFFNNVNFIPRAANNLFQLKVANAGGEVARFGINSTLGVA